MSEEKEHTSGARYGQQLAPEEVEPSFSVPALSANKFVIQPMDMAIRIAFGEEAPNTGSTYYRFAVTLSNPHAVELYRVLAGSLREYEDAVAKAEQPAEAPGDG